MTNMNFDELSQQAYATAKAHGWHDIELPDEHWLMLIITEIAYAVQADRKGRHADKKGFIKDCVYDDDNSFQFSFDLNIKNSVEDELSDILIRCLDFGALRGIPFDMAESIVTGNVGKFKDTSFPKFMYYLCMLSSCDDETLANKLNTIVALIILYCKLKDIDIDFFVEQKMRYNKLRSYKHGNKKY